MGGGSVPPMTSSHRPPQRLAPGRYLELLRADSARFVEVLAGADPSAGVPSCPDWTAADLLWHLTEVQWFWGTIVADRLADPGAAEDRRPRRPDDHESALDLFTATSDALVAALAAVPDDAPVWTWHEPDQTAGFVRRRQAHEALIHRLDAELVVGDATPLDPELATDGVDEVLQVMYGGTPAWATFTRTAGPVAIRSTDTAAGWDLAIGTITGVEPGPDVVVDAEPAVEVTDGSAPAVAEVRADAAALDAWLWNRVDRSAVTVSGDPVAITALEQVLSSGLQ